MLCKHCYEDIGLFGQKNHVCPEKKYMQKPVKMTEQEKRNADNVRKRDVKPKEYGR